MKLNTTSLVIGWFGALILMWLVVSLNSNAATLIEAASAATSNDITSTNKHWPAETPALKGF
ncbi:hypothetical protein A9Q99_03340 [Gammaproteobacteria bacterium 45_16_T64]|nr:hypothetical protein A9Q99_03340 [Gammaproteobacteria bacterium 45_16_T64]